MTEEEKKRQQEAAQDEKQQLQQATSSTGTASTNTGSTTNAQSQTQNTWGYQDTGYKPGAAVQQAQALLQQQMDSKPGAYQSKWSDEVNGILDQILNREKFQYDYNEDALYQQYRDQYLNDSQMAMMDTMGAASALTGGYGSSYGQSVGQQAYQQNMKGLYELLPELQGMALDRYNQEGQDLLNRYGLAQDQENTDYGRYMDQMNQYYQDLQMAQDWYNTERGYDYGIYRDSVTDQQQKWANAWAMFQAGQDTPEIRAILGLPAAEVSSGGGGGSTSRNTGGPPTDNKVYTHNDMTKDVNTYIKQATAAGEDKKTVQQNASLLAGTWYQQYGKYR